MGAYVAKSRSIGVVVKRSMTPPRISMPPKTIGSAEMSETRPESDPNALELLLTQTKSPMPMPTLIAPPTIVVAALPYR